MRDLPRACGFAVRPSRESARKRARSAEPDAFAIALTAREFEFVELAGRV
jgi:hypothetical protein